MEPQRHDNNFDLIRLLAALQVVVLHTFAWLKVPLPYTFSSALVSLPGVAVFFVVSGFLITRSYLNPTQTLAGYFARRALRIYPALWLQYVLVTILMAATGGFAWSTLADPHAWSWFAAAGLVGSNFWASVLTNFNPFSWAGLYKWYPADVLWTIPVEIGFYLLVPLVFARWLGRRGLIGVVVLASFALSVTAAYLAGPLLRDHGELNSTGEIHSSPLPYFWLFLTGGAAAFYWPRVRRFFEGQALWWILAYTAATLAAWATSGVGPLPYRTPDPSTIPRALIMAGVILSFAHTWTWLARWMRGVDLSYGLYLFHLPMPFGLYYAGIGGSLWYVAASIAVAFALAAFSWFAVERHALRLKTSVDASLRVAA